VTYVLTLVHGTWARGAPWTQPGSPLRSHLESRLGPNISFRVFEWTGQNSHTARLTAGEDLRHDLHQALKTHPQAQHFLIGHSHGGNVILYALRDPVLKDQIAGVVTLGTPFLDCQPRELERRIRSLSYTLPVLAAPLFLFIVVALAVLVLDTASRLFGGFGDGVWMVLTIWVAMSVLVGGKDFVKWMHHRILESGGRWAKNRQRLVLAQLSPPFLPYLPILCLRFQGDEPGYGLWILDALSGLPALLSRGVVSAVSVFITAIGILPPALFALVIIDTETSWLGDWTSETILDGFLSLAFTVAWYLLILQLLMVVIPKLIRTHPLGFGPEAMLDYLVATVSVGPRPSGCTRISEEKYRLIRAVRTIGLRRALRYVFKLKIIHSAIYEYKPALERCAEWIGSFSNVSGPRGAGQPA
jgi:hypothetical protein